jgi:hypothetical protein
VNVPLKPPSVHVAVTDEVAACAAGASALLAATSRAARPALFTPDPKKISLWSLRH